VAEHDYPCLGIGVTIPTNFNSDGKNVEIELWTVFCMYVFLGICKVGQRQHGFEVSARSSLGHLETTVADCWQTFRINVGLIGPQQEKLLIGYLRELNLCLISLLGRAKHKEIHLLYTADNVEVNPILFSSNKKNRDGVGLRSRFVRNSA